MKNYFVACFLVFTLLAIGGLQSSSAQEDPIRVQADRTVQAYRASNPPTIDGDLSEWPQIGEIPLNYSTADTIQGQFPSLQDASATLQVVWDANTIFFAVRVSDDTIVTDSPDVWRDDGIELGIDGNADGQRSGPTDHQYTLVADGRYTDSAVPFAAATFAVKAISGGYQMEYAIPASHVLGHTLSDNQLMGFTWSLHDDDNGGQWDTWMIWEGDQTGTNYDQFGQLIFNPQIVSFPIPNPRRTVQAYQANIPPVIDGDLSEWPQLDSISLNTQTADTVQGEISSANDNSATLRVAWDSSALYFAILVDDNVLVADSSDIWRDDSIELALDGDLNQTRTSAPPDHQYTLNIDGRMTDFALPFNGASYAVRRLHSGYAVEFSVPASQVLGYSLSAGATMGFNWAVHDDDNGGNWDSWMIWEGDQTGTNYYLFGRMYLGSTSAGFSHTASTLSYLPFLVHQQTKLLTLPSPNLDSISNPDCNGDYIVSWNEVALSSFYLLQESKDSDFSNPVTLHQGKQTSHGINGNGATRYHYRVKAVGDFGDSEWSSTKTVDVCFEAEDNDDYSQANGPLLSGLSYFGYPTDQKDYYKFYSKGGHIEVELDDHRGSDVQLQLFYQHPPQLGEPPEGYDPTAPYEINYDGGAGWYYVYIYTAPDSLVSAPYSLRVTYP